MRCNSSGESVRPISPANCDGHHISHSNAVCVNTVRARTSRRNAAIRPGPGCPGAAGSSGARPSSAAVIRRCHEGNEQDARIPVRGSYGRWAGHGRVSFTVSSSGLLWRRLSNCMNSAYSQPTSRTTAHSADSTRICSIAHPLPGATLGALR